MPNSTIDKIFVIPRLSWKTRGVTFIATLTILWLLLDPIPSFLGDEAFVQFGFWGYVGLIVLSLLIVIGIEVFHRVRYKSTMEFINLKIVLTQEGKRYLVEVPLDMLVEKVVSLFLSHIRKRVHSEQAKNVLMALSNFYQSTLWVKRRDEYNEVPADKTVRDAGLQNNDECQIRGNILSLFESLIAFLPGN